MTESKRLQLDRLDAWRRYVSVNRYAHYLRPRTRGAVAWFHFADQLYREYLYAWDREWERVLLDG